MSRRMTTLDCVWFVLVISAAVVTGLDLNEPLENDEIIDAINKGQNTWKAGRNFDLSLTKSYIKHLLGLKKRPGGRRLPPPPVIGDEVKPPSSFDARDKWPNCTGLHTLRDQGPCGSCWAVAAASAFTDRLCIATKGQFNDLLSGQNLVSCCSFCGDGCEGGDDDMAWYYFNKVGIVTGGDFHSHQGCQPYTLPTCEHHVPGPRKNCSTYGIEPTPKCKKTCYNENYNTSYNDDLWKVRAPYTISLDVGQMQKDIMTYGPLEASIDVYDDFPSYKSGVYEHKYGEYLGGHAVKVIGWGVENNTPYWLVANSWNSDWGDKGFFKIKRGTNECGFEEDMSGGFPITK